MDKKTKKKHSIINRDIIVMWLFSATWGFIAYLYWGFQPIGNWIWSNIIYVSHSKNVLNPNMFVVNSVSFSHFVIWFIVFSLIYIFAFSILVILPTCLYLCRKRRTETEQKKNEEGLFN